jgi:hypothetical protein
MARTKMGMREKRVSDYKDTFGSPEGQRVLLDLMGAHGMLSPGFHKDPIEMARMAGERNVIIRILSLINVDLKQLKQKVEDANELAKAEFV